MTNEYYDDSNVDWTQGQPQGQAANTVKAEDFVMAEADVVDADALDQEAKERQTFPVPPGPAHLEVAGWYQQPTEVSKDIYYQGQAYKLTSFAVTVKFAVVGQPQYQVGNWFLLPPTDPNMMVLYTHGSTKADMSTVGFYAEVTGHFLNRLFPGQFQVGSKLPPIARELKNWIGRRIYAEVVPGRASTNINPATRQPYPVRPQVKLYSWSSTPIVRAPRPGQVLPGQQPLPFSSRQESAAGQPAGQPVSRPVQPTAPAAAQQIDRSGLANL